MTTRTHHHLRAPIAVLAALSLFVSLALPAGGVAAAPTPKVVLIVLENRSSSAIVGNPAAPYLNSLIPQGMLFSGYHSVVPGSLHNYLAMTSGRTDRTSPPSDNVFRSLELAGLSWQSLQESMGTNCGGLSPETVPGTLTPLYTRIHDAAYQYRKNEGCAAADMPLVSDSQLGSLPAFTTIIPNQCDDMFAYPSTGSCPSYFGPLDASSSTAIGDAWLSHVVPLLLVDPGVTVFVTFDEGTRVDPQIYAVEVGARAQPGSVIASSFDHYGLLAGLYAAFGLPAPPNNAAAAPPVPVPDLTPPTSPANLLAGWQPDEVDLTWDPSTDDLGVTGYTVYRDAVPIAAVPASVAPAFPDTTAGQASHTYVVTASDYAGNESAPSGPAQVGPSVPTGLALTVLPGEVDLSWDASSDPVGVTGYTVYRDGTAIATTPDGTSTSYADVGVSRSTPHTYAVDAFDAAGIHSSLSDPATSQGIPVVVIFMENHSYAGLEAFPPEDRVFLDTFASGGVRFSNYTEGDGTGPSLPDYLQFAAGSSCGAVKDGVVPGKFGEAQGCPTTVWNQMESVGLSWGVYEDAMPEACSGATMFNSDVLGTPYALRHNPATPFASIWSDQALCVGHVLPFTDFPTLNAGSLPALSFITPGICNDQHGSTSVRWTNCLPNTDALMQRGDTWLATYVPAMLAAGAKVIITYDENGILYAAEQGPGIAAGTVDPTPLSHYGLLRGIEDYFGLGCLNNACTATPFPV